MLAPLTLPQSALNHISQDALAKVDIALATAASHGPSGEGGHDVALPAAALAHIPADALTKVLEAFANAGGNADDAQAALAAGADLTLPAVALAHIPADALAIVENALADAGSDHSQGPESCYRRSLSRKALRLSSCPRWPACKACRS